MMMMMMMMITIVIIAFKGAIRDFFLVSSRAPRSVPQHVP